MANQEYMQELDLDDKDQVIINDPSEEINDDDDLAIEVVDDTPEQDRNRKPLPDEVKQQLEEEDVEEYSTKVQQRIDQMKKAWHDERRAKEAALRERDEAAKVAQMAYAERQKYQKALVEGEVWALEQAKQRAALQMEQAKSAYKRAYEEGDTEKLMEAQQALNMSTLDFDRVSQYRPQYALQPQENAVYQEQQRPQPQEVRPQLDQRVVDWSEKNKWFGSDDEMTSFALGFHNKLVKEGVSPQTDEYYERIDARMRELFPERFGAKKRQPSTVVAPVGRSPKGKKVVLTQTQVALAKRLGITPEQYAKELVKQMGA